MEVQHFKLGSINMRALTSTIRMVFSILIALPLVLLFTFLLIKFSMNSISFVGVAGAFMNLILLVLSIGYVALKIEEI